MNWKPVAASGIFLAVCAGVFGTGTIRPYVTSTASASGATVITDLKGSAELFDPSKPHEVKLTFTDAAYEEMLTEYFKSGEKNYVEADLVIDGTTIPSVGVRLKGNSTLGSLTWNGKGREGGRGPVGGGFQPPEGFEPPPGGGFAGTGGMSLKAEEPENLPWLISFDEFAEGRRYQGHSQIAVRPTSMGSSTLLKESLAISMVDTSGEPSQGYAYSAFSVNGRSSGPRLLVEYLDEGYAEELGDGVLYKSLATSSFTYRGEDQTSYMDDYKQINAKGEQDLQPVIDLVKWVEQSSDEEFAAGLAAKLDVESFARYLALQNMLLNFDDMAGPGRNYYLWHDLTTKKFKVITWDLNLAFSGDATAGPDDALSMGGFGRMRQGDRRPADPTGAQDAAAGRSDGQSQAPEQAQRRPGGGGTRMGHTLKDRFLETPAFKKIYEEQYQKLYQDLLSSGKADTLLDRAVASYQANQGADATEAQKELASLRETLTTRTKSLGDAFAKQ
ncbi:CotH kinase family protein [Herbidospora cretacea]|uniref:CotH kinase family protein n=1 Tax=Herbidospora cretacea TaxID=28444 RepID=UPI0012F9B9DF|nr:CotH kinase family protein [Herbidospora cretacea]